MNEVQPIRDRNQITAMKQALNGRDKLLLVIGINSGLRVSDLLSLTVGDVRGKDTVVIREGKTGKTKRFYFNKSIKQAVSELVSPDSPDNEFLFKSRKGSNRPISRVQAYRILNQAANRAGIGEIGTHSLRKTFGYHAYKNGTDISLLMRIFNHSKQSHTLRYIGITEDSIEEVYATINL